MTLIKELRNKENLSQLELAKKLDISHKTLGSWERGYRTPRPKDMQRLEDYFGVPKEEIFFEAFCYSKQ